MKKLLLFLLVLAGGVSTASAVTIYVQNTRAWSSIYLYEWNEGSAADVAFPGTRQCVREIVGNDWYFKINITREKFILSQNGDYDKKTEDQTTSKFEEGAYYWIWEDHKGLTKMDAPTSTTSYTLNIKTDASCPITNIYTYQGDNKLSGNWPGAEVIANEGEYTLTIKSSSISGNINVICNQGNGMPQTGDLWADEGDNKYYIASLGTESGHGEGQKTNNYGYTTYTCYSPLTIPSGIAYYATDNDNGSATAHALTNPAASTSMLIHGEPNTIYHFAKASTGTDYTVTNAFKAIKVEGEETGNNLETGSGPFNYILNGNAFYKANGKWVGKEKAYLQLSKAATARVLLFDDEEETTGITSVKAENSNVYFDLQGRRVAQPTKGLYIVNGKKYFAK